MLTNPLPDKDISRTEEVTLSHELSGNCDLCKTYVPRGTPVFVIPTVATMKNVYFSCLSCGEIALTQVLLRRRDPDLRLTIKAVISAYAFHVTTGRWPRRF
jgi:hypothetical protein